MGITCTMDTGHKFYNHKTISIEEETTLTNKSLTLTQIIITIAIKIAGLLTQCGELILHQRDLGKFLKTQKTIYSSYREMLLKIKEENKEVTELLVD